MVEIRIALRAVEVGIDKQKLTSRIEPGVLGRTVELPCQTYRLAEGLIVEQAPIDIRELVGKRIQAVPLPRLFFRRELVGGERKREVS